MSFDRLAPWYRWMELLCAGQKLQRGRIAFLGQIPPPRHILLPGEGHGRTLRECRRRFPEARITCVDASAGMIAQARSLPPARSNSSTPTSCTGRRPPRLTI